MTDRAFRGQLLRALAVGILAAGLGACYYAPPPPPPGYAYDYSPGYYYPGYYYPGYYGPPVYASVFIGGHFH
jgi:hypothetical protein